MSTAAVDTRLKRTWGLYEVYIGKKLVMAGTGVILVLYVIGHMLGNLQIFAGPEQMNRYAAFLHSQPGLLWTARIVLVAAVVAHIWSSFLLWLEKRRARPVAYVKKNNVPASYASRTMMWSGPIIAAFVVFHVLHLTTGDVGLGFQAPTPGGGGETFYAYQNVVNGFQHPAVSAAYIFALVLLTMHLYHGMWSMFQSVGISHPRYTPLLKGLAHVLSIAIAVGYISIPIYVMIRFGVK